jgi:glycosyltransferase involved in cell wall biosynthesis
MISSFSDLSFDMATFDNSRDLNNEINYAKWGSDNYSHDGVRVSRALMTIASMNSKLFQQESLCSMSIVIPVLNEIPTLAKVLNDVVTFDWLGEGFVPQIIVVDGGSSDGSWEYLKTVNGILALSSADTPGRGSAIRKGIMHARGEVVVTFPADDEYAVDSLIDIGRALVEKDVGIVFGSRSTLCIDTDARLREIYGGRTREYFLSKWGGFLLSSISAVKYHRWISDPLTSIKGFKKNDKMNLSFIGDSLNWDTRIIIDSWKQRVPIMEVAVDYVPRTRRQGKKTTVHSGLMALWELIKSNR